MTSEFPLTLDKPFSLSNIIAGMPFPSEGKTAAVSDFVASLGQLAFSVAIFFFAALNVIPAPPGASALLGIPLVILSLQKLFGFSLWLPRFITRAEISRERYKSIRENLLKGVLYVERHVKPRGNWVNTQSASPILDLSVVILSLCVLTPLPFTAILPAVSICIISLGRMEQDGRCISIGLLLGGASAAICTFVVYGSSRLFLLIAGM